MASFESGFTPIVAIFYSAFHPTGGPQVLSQVPSGAIVPPIRHKDTSTLESTLFKFDLVKSYVIPKPQLCNRLVTFKVGKYRVVGFPVNISDPSYPRNFFVFNFAFVFKYRGESAVYETSIRRLARMFMALEEQSKFLSRRTTYETIDSLLQQIYQDINNYSECMIPIDESNTVNMKLFPLFPSPPDLKSYQVPISTVQLSSMVDVNWDPTMEKIIKYINGINSVRRIADLAEADYDLVRKCIQHLMHYSCITIIDLFQFSNIYAPTSTIADFINKPEMRMECQRYVYHQGYINQHAKIASGTSNNNNNNNNNNSNANNSNNNNNVGSFSPASSVSSSMSSSSLLQKAPEQGYLISSYSKLYNLYLSLHQGITVREWYNTNKKDLRNIDVRRFLTFGVIKGIIYRVNTYPIGKTLKPDFEYLDKSLHKSKPEPRHGSIVKVPHNPVVSSISPSNSYDNRRTVGKSKGINSASHGTGEFSYNSSASNSSTKLAVGHNSSNSAQEKIPPPVDIDDMISSILHEPRHFDAICTDTKKPKAEIERILEERGDWTIIGS
ncbi:similar to Saccharomyces cerevisiae YEL062W NPR2 Subunit of SEA (Seh1-associated), Npr2/3, and Iml1p complexes [Geotrichum candidum]|uniref:Similar to Saccharomyces cerevisiae YEL062W NPR2 Subunit of SEA (Seh1-associated), Npr2/3, and Iml1p complexes n=1 Tax=Geotrichum candidum TaxID=1173061 RepID=A0A0J9XFV8_GEOCN|nr:similar to Saccharomyces cerevisiae YEL062W NPR2 Subunit of SEA (Seh1-associated), Npr2/3, and Iml1p complexes [Geotrichum candidum]